MRAGGARRPRPRVSALRALRPLLFLLMFVFVALPMLVYNFLTLDYTHVSRWSARIRTGLTATTHDDALDTPLPLQDTLPGPIAACARVTSAALRSATALRDLQKQCFAETDLALAAEPPLPDLVHFVYLPIQGVPLLAGERKPRADNFTFVQFAAVQSVRKFLKPKMMILHYPATEPRSYWYTQCQRHLSLHRVSFPKLPATGKSSLTVYQRREVMQLLLLLRALRKQGGVAFGDFNTFVVRALHHWRQFAVLSGMRAGKTFSISPHFMQAAAGNAYVTFLEARLQQMLETDDRRLADTPLDQLIGELTLEKFASLPAASTTTEEAQRVPNAVFAAPSVLDAVPLQRMAAFVSASVKDKSPVNLRDATAFHLDNYDYAHHSVLHEGIAALTRSQAQFQDGEALGADATLFGALLRYATSLNKTAEMDSHLLGR